ncbi:MAG: S-layer homology domain-containing protein [Clostridia bacterium]|nr:S-layer homology domain-containing protein [Clostridia bacterium]
MKLHKKAAALMLVAAMIGTLATACATVSEEPEKTVDEEPADETVLNQTAETAAATSSKGSVTESSVNVEEEVREEFAEDMAYEIVEEPAVGMGYPSVTYPGYVASTPSTEITDQAELDAKLAEITLLVRNTVDIGDEYTTFNGNFSDSVTHRMWYLYWSNDENDINVTAAEDGTVINYNKYYHKNNANKYGTYNRFYNPKFQKTTRDEAKEAVKSFARRVLSETESYNIKDYDYETLSPLEVNSFYFNAVMTVNGLETPVGLNFTVDAETLEVTRFSRGDFNDSYFGSYPSANPNYTDKNAFNALSGKFDNTLKYYIVYDENDTEHLYPKAQLQYRFSPTGDWYMDALTGEVIDRNTLYSSVDGRGVTVTTNAVAEDEVEMMEMPAAEGGMKSYTLTQVELDNIEKMKDVLAPEKIALKVTEKYPEFGLQYFEISSSNYSRNLETDEVTANLYFSKPVESGAEIGMSEKAFTENTAGRKNVYYIRKYVTADGKTGELLSYSTNMPYISDKEYDGLERTTDTATIGADFLKKNFPEEFGLSALTYTYTDTNNTYANYQYTHTVNGYPLDANYLYVTVNAIDGTINSFNRWWVDNVEFESADGIISAEKALEIYTSEYAPDLRYITVPVAIDDKAPEFIPYINAGWGGGYVYAFKTAYMLKSEGRTYAVTAKDGEPLKYEYVSSEGYTKYTDIDECGNPDRIEKLAAYGITYGGTAFEPKKTLTQCDMLVFLLNSMGSRYSAESTDESYIESIYSQAVYYGFIDESEKAPDQKMKKEDVAKAIIRATEYGAAANLAGLFKADYKDAADISEGLAPYLLIADETGIMDADGDNNIKPQEYMTREDLAEVVYAFMNR